MDKEAFLHQLESSTTKNDTKLFAKIISDLPADLIVGFTKEEFLLIIYTSQQFSSQKMDRLCNFLELNGSFFLKNALKGIDELNNYLLSKFYFSLYISLYETNKEKVKRVLVSHAIACYNLAEMGIDSKDNLETAVRLYDDAQKILPKTSADYALALMNDGTARSKLADMGIDSRENLETAVRLYMDAQEILPKKNADYARALINEGNARQRLAEIGIDSIENIETTVKLYRDAQKILPKTSASHARALINESNLRQRLADMGIDSRENLETAVRLYMDAQKILPKTSVDYTLALINEGSARQRLADMGIDSRENLETAVKLYMDAQKILPKTSADYARALINEGNARLRLANMGIDSTENLETAFRLYMDAQKILPETSVDYARALINEGNARSMLADMGVDSRENLETTVKLYMDAQKILPKTSADYARALGTKGNVRQRLADMGIDSRENLETAVRLYIDAQEILPKKSADYARALMNEGSARSMLADMGIDGKENLETTVKLYMDAQKILPKTSADYARALINEGNARLRLSKMRVDSNENLETTVKLYMDAQKILPETSVDYAIALINEGNARSMLADMGVDSKENLETTVKLYMDAQKILPKTSVDYARALINEGNARLRLVEIGVDSKENLENSKKLYLKSISILEELRDGWSYSLALLNLNSLLKNNYYKTGDKKHLEEWEKNLGDIEEKITGRDIRYKEIVVARIHEIRASLLEFNGELGISNASLEYYKAYEISNEIFYKFMGEFCQARIVKPSIFCSLVSDWKEVEKECIFLDYYDYAVFECHLENALKSTINEEEELKLAVEKLKGIRDRTQIKIIKDRVSAYIYLLQAIVDCFNNDSYKEAAENVKEGCKIFREYGDKQGQQMCEIFHNAVVRKNPEAWQEIIRNREFSSNFYSLLCEYSDRKRADLESHKLSQIHEVVSRTEEKVDQLQATLNRECNEIKDKVENGFDGTVSELREIKVKINSIQEDFEHLIQVSNKVSGNEGEFIREFVTQMLDLMKKGEVETIYCFLEEITKSETSLEETLENGKIPEKEKAEAKSKLADLKKIPGIIKEKTKSFSVDVTKDVVVTLTSNEIIKLLTPVLSTAIFGVPIPSKVVEILLEAMKDS